MDSLKIGFCFSSAGHHLGPGTLLMGVNDLLCRLRSLDFEVKDKRPGLLNENEE